MIETRPDEGPGKHQPCKTLHEFNTFFGLNFNRLQGFAGLRGKFGKLLHMHFF